MFIIIEHGFQPFFTRHCPTIFLNIFLFVYTFLIFLFINRNWEIKLIVLRFFKDYLIVLIIIICIVLIIIIY